MSPINPDDTEFVYKKPTPESASEVGQLTRKSWDANTDKGLFGTRIRNFRPADRGEISFLRIVKIAEAYDRHQAGELSSEDFIGYVGSRVRDV